MAKKTETYCHWECSSTHCGVFLVIVGFLWMGSTLGWITGALAQAWAPLVILLSGLYILLKHYG
jgi:apolipoprotein N-acyltransferase